jgi:hypothetical protein
MGNGDAAAPEKTTALRGLRWAHLTAYVLDMSLAGIMSSTGLFRPFPLSCRLPLPFACPGSFVYSCIIAALLRVIQRDVLVPSSPLTGLLR